MIGMSNNTPQTINKQKDIMTKTEKNTEKKGKQYYEEDKERL